MNELRKLTRSKAKAKKALDALPVSPEQIAFDAAEKALNKFFYAIEGEGERRCQPNNGGETKNWQGYQ